MPYKPGPCPPLTEDQISAKLTKIFKEDNDGKLSKEEVSKVFEELGSRFPGWRAHRALRRADANNDGYISLDEKKELLAYIHERNYKIK